MKSQRRNRVLGLALGDRSVVVAEVRAAGAQPEVVKVGEYVYPDGVNLLQPEALGQGLGAYLRDQGFAARSAVFGLPAKWVLTKSKDVPATDASTLAEMLRLQAEGEFSAEIKDLVFDYAGAAGGGSVLLMAVPGRYVAGAKAIADAARLEAVAVTPSASALGAATAVGRRDAMVLSVSPGGAEFTVQAGPHVRVLRHVGSPSSPAPVLVGELRRSTAGLARTGKAGGTNGDGRELTVWDDAAIAPATLQSIGESLGVSLRTGTLEGMGLVAAGVPEGSRRGSAAAVALALAGVSGDVLPVDFLHSRLAAPKQKGLLRRSTVLAAAAVLAVLVGGVMAYQYQQGIKAEAAKIDVQVKQKATEAAAAKAVVDRIEFAEKWHARDPRYLANLRDLTKIIVEKIEDQQTYITSFTLRDNMNGTMTGKTPERQGTGSKMIQDLTAAMTGSKRFMSVSPRFEAGTSKGRGAGESTFHMTFVYLPENAPPPKEAPTPAASGRSRGGTGGARQR